MGGLQAYQITHISIDNIFTGIRLINNDSIVNYINFIVKVNKEQVDESIFKRVKYVKELQLYNIIHKKEFTIIIDTMDVSLFLNGLSLYFCSIPNLINVLVTSELQTESNALKENVNIGDIILASNINDKCYFLEGIGSISVLIKRKQTVLIFYKLKEQKCIVVDFEKYRDNQNNLKLGFTAEVVNLELFLKDTSTKIVYEEKDYAQLFEEAVKISQNQANNLFINCSNNKENLNFNVVNPFSTEDQEEIKNEMISKDINEVTVEEEKSIFKKNVN